jgi:hypothetical protein
MTQPRPNTGPKFDVRIWLPALTADYPGAYHMYTEGTVVFMNFNP